MSISPTTIPTSPSSRQPSTHNSPTPTQRAVLLSSRNAPPPRDQTQRVRTPTILATATLKVLSAPPQPTAGSPCTTSTSTTSVNRAMTHTHQPPTQLIYKSPLSPKPSEPRQSTQSALQPHTRSSPLRVTVSIHTLPPSTQSSR